MAKDFSFSFYHSMAWRNTRTAYAKAKGRLCERCLSKGIYSPGTIVHHKIHLTPENVTDINVCLDWNNLELLCRECHAEEHADDMEGGREAYREAHRKTHDRFKVDHLGRVTAK